MEEQDAIRQARADLVVFTPPASSSGTASGTSRNPSRFRRGSGGDLMRSERGAGVVSVILEPRSRRESIASLSTSRTFLRLPLNLPGSAHTSVPATPVSRFQRHPLVDAQDAGGHETDFSGNLYSSWPIHLGNSLHASWSAISDLQLGHPSCEAVTVTGVPRS